MSLADRDSVPLITTLCGFGNEPDGRIRYVLCRGEFENEFRSRESAAKVEQVWKSLIEQVNTALQKWTEDPCDECEKRLREAVQRHGMRLFHSALDDTGQKLLYNYVEGCDVLAVVGDIVTPIPWEMLYCRSGMRDFILGEEAVVVRAFKHGIDEVDFGGFVPIEVAGGDLRLTTHSALGVSVEHGAIQIATWDSLCTFLNECRCIAAIGIGFEDVVSKEKRIQLEHGPPSFAIGVDDIVAGGLESESLILLVACELASEDFAGALARRSRSTVISCPVKIPRCVVPRLVTEWVRLVKRGSGKTSLPKLMRSWVSAVKDVGLLFEVCGKWNVSITHGASDEQRN